MPQIKTYSLDALDAKLRIQGPPEDEYFHLYGLLLREEKNVNSTCWVLADETCINGICIKLCGDIEHYPRPRPGDVVRIHRASWDKQSKVPAVLSPRNIVYWRAFVYQPEPISTAKKPTITDEDNEIRRRLEVFYCSYLDKIVNIKPMPTAKTEFHNIAGRVMNKDADRWNSCLLTVKDETGEIVVRVFQKQNDLEVQDHHELANQTQPGDLVAVVHAKLDKTGCQLHLSANRHFGRSIRLVEKDSILGVKLNQALGPTESDQESISVPSSQPSSQSSCKRMNPYFTTPPPLRRSPRLNKQSQQYEQHDTSRELNTETGPDSVFLPSQEDRAVEDPALPKYDTLFKISKIHENGYKFFDIAGQIRGQPQEAAYGSWVFQIYDGSSLDYGSFFTSDVKEPIADCAVVKAYAPGRPTDTTQHIDVIKNLHEGDLVHIKNVKVSWKLGKLRLEMSASLEHGKSINVIPRDSKFGTHLLEIATTPFVYDLAEEQLYSTPPDTDSEADGSPS